MKTTDFPKHAQQFININNWQEQYRLLMKLGGDSNKTSQTDKTEKSLVHGCESQVWLQVNQSGERYQFSAISDSRIVSGLIVLLLEALNDKDKTYIESFDLNNYFEQLGLSQQLSQSRTKGLCHIFEHIKQLTTES